LWPQWPDYPGRKGVADTRSSAHWLLILVAAALCLLVALVLYQGEQLRHLEAHLGMDRGSRQVASSAAAGVAERRQIYVAAYSHVYSPQGLPILLEAALSVRNTDPGVSLTLERVDYFDANGKLLRRFLKQSVVLGPLKSAEFIVEKSDFDGGMGANFLVAWRSKEPLNPPLAEAIMLGVDPQYQISFSSRGVPITTGGPEAARDLR
jgi:hypothetical protein